MRKRLTAAFVLLALAVVVAFAVVRAVALDDQVRQRAADQLASQARVAARVLSSSVAEGRQVRSADVEAFVEPRQQVEVSVAGAGTVRASGSGFADDTDAADQVVARASSGQVTAVVRQSSTVTGDVYRDNLVAVGSLALLLLVLAALLGWLVAGAFTRPFRELALAATSLQRGRFDVRAPESAMPEVRRVGEALEGAADRMRREITRDQEFLAEASHRLRTPMTGMRLELEELQLRGDLDADARATLARSIESLDRLQSLTTGIFDLARTHRGTFDEGQVPLEQVGRHAADSWARDLGQRGVRVSVAVEGDPAQLVTPGPLEQLLDLLSDDLQRLDEGSVRLVVTGSEEQVSVSVAVEQPAGVGAEAGPAPRAAVAGGRLDEVQQLVSALGGRCSGDPVAGGLRAWLPRR